VSLGAVSVRVLAYHSAPFVDEAISVCHRAMRVRHERCLVNTGAHHDDSLDHAAQPSLAQPFNPMQRTLIIPQANQQRTTIQTFILSDAHSRYTTPAADDASCVLCDGYRKARPMRRSVQPPTRRTKVHYIQRNDRMPAPTSAPRLEAQVSTPTTPAGETMVAG
jgi:hypothetical protein